MVILQVDDSKTAGTERFLQTEDQMSAVSLWKPGKFLGKDKIKFNGVEISLKNDELVRVDQQKKLLELKMPTTQ